MNAIAPSSSSRTPRRQTRFVIVRANAPLFYSVVIASFLETDAAGAGRQLIKRLGAYGESAEWIHSEWLPTKESRANALRLYVEQCWPEFDWSAGYEQYRAMMSQTGEAAAYRATPACEALAHCVNGAQAGLYYRALATWSDDHDLRSLARTMAEQEAAAFQQFRGMYERTVERGGAGILAAWRVTAACVRYARDTRVALAFQAINAHVTFNAPFPVLAYSEFVGRMQSVIVRCAGPVWPERFLFSAWRRPRQVVQEPARRPVASWFRPVLSQAA